MQGLRIRIRFEGEGLVAGFRVKVDGSGFGRFACGRKLARGSKDSEALSTEPLTLNHLP